MVLYILTWTCFRGVSAFNFAQVIGHPEGGFHDFPQSV